MRVLQYFSSLILCFLLVFGFPTQVFAAAYNISDAIFAQIALDVSDQASVSVAGLNFNNNGGVLYVVDPANNEIYEYALSTPYDVSSATYTQVALDSLIDRSPQDILFNSDGSVLYVVGDEFDRIDEYALSTPYDVSSATYTQVALDASGQDIRTETAFFDDTGDTLYILGRNNLSIFEYALSTPYDVSSATYTQVALDVSSEGLIAPRNAIYNNDGSVLYVLESFSNDEIHEYALSTPYDVSSATYTQMALDTDTAAGQIGPHDMLFNDDGNVLYALDTGSRRVYEYTLFDETDPIVSSFSPTDNATGVVTDSNLVITFDENVDAESGNITLKKSSDDSTVETFDVTSDISGSGTTEITINPTSDLDEETEYYIQIDATAFDDPSGNSFAGIGDTTTWSFTTADETNPIVSTLSPVDNATDVSISANLVITFDEAVDAETGNITLKASSDDSTVETFDVTSDISGSATTEVTINPTENLSYSTEYYIQIAATAFDDASGNSYAGISDTTTWSFTTTSEPVQSSGSSSSGILYGCKDKEASNYQFFARHKQELCEYEKTENTRSLVNTESQLQNQNTSQTEEDGDTTCATSESLLTQNLKRGARDGNYHNYTEAKVQQVALLQQRINEILRESYDNPAGPVDGIFGPLTEEGVRRMQLALAERYNKDLGVYGADGIVGPFTRNAINAWCEG